MAKKQSELNKKYLANNPLAREKAKISGYKSQCNKYISEYADIEELKRLASLIESRIDSINKNSKPVVLEVFEYQKDNQGIFKELKFKNSEEAFKSLNAEIQNFVDNNKKAKVILKSLVDDEILFSKEIGGK